MNQVKSWSFSRYNDYKGCPARFKHKHLDKLPEAPNAAMQRGTDIHKSAEDYVNGLKRTLPKELKLFEAQFKALRKEKVKTVEESWTWTQAWAAETRWNDWAGAWLRVKIDVTFKPDPATLVIVDHKTGKISDYKKEEYKEQLELYGLAGLKRDPLVEKVKPVLWYLDHGIEYAGEPPVVFTRKDEKPLERTWAARIKPMFSDKTFKPTPSRACDWCPYSKKEGGPCKY